MRSCHLPRSGSLKSHLVTQELVSCANYELVSCANYELVSCANYERKRFVAAPNDTVLLCVKTLTVAKRMA